MITLYHFIHCPYCIRVRMVCGYLNIPYESVPSRYSEAERRREISGHTTVPFVVKETGDVVRESLDIIEWLDADDLLGLRKLKPTADYEALTLLIDQLSATVHPVVWPHWLYTPEFDEADRQYVYEKKKKPRHIYADLFHAKGENLLRVQPLLEQIESQLTPFYQHDHITIADILIAAHLWGLYVVPEFQFSPTLHDYLQGIKQACGFDYQGEFWQ